MSWVAVARMCGSASGRVRAYAAHPAADGKAWLQDDYIYSASTPTPLSASQPMPATPGIPATAGTPTSPGKAATARPSMHDSALPQTSSSSDSDGPADAWASVRWYDDTLLMTWRLGDDGVGRLWSGVGSGARTALWADGQGQRALLHLIGSKQRRPFRGLIASAALLHDAASMLELHVTTRGLLIALDGGGGGGGGGTRRQYRYHWYSGAFPGACTSISSWLPMSQHISSYIPPSRP